MDPATPLAAPERRRHVISGNTGDGISVTGGNNLLLNNLIGTNAAGTAALGNGPGISLDQTAGNVIRGNVVSGNGVGPNGGDGIDLTGSGRGGPTMVRGSSQQHPRRLTTPLAARNGAGNARVMCSTAFS